MADPVTYDEFDDASIDPAWTQSSVNPVIEDGAEGGTINYATTGTTDKAGLFQEFAAASNFTTTLDLVLRNKVSKPLKPIWYSEVELNVWDNNVNLFLNLHWVAGAFSDGSPNAGVERYIIEADYQTDVENERQYWEIPGGFATGWALIRMAHVAGELRFFYSVDPFAGSWIDVTPTAVSTFYGQLGGHGGYGWGFEIEFRTSAATPLGGAYRNYTDYLRNGSSFAPARSRKTGAKSLLFMR